MTYYRVVSIRTMYGMLMIHEALIIWHISLQIMCIAQALFTYTTQHIINNPSRVREENDKQWHIVATHWLMRLLVSALFQD